MSTDEIRQAIQDWIDYCVQSPLISCLPYIDAPLEIERKFEYVWDIAKHGPGVISAWRDALEEHIQLNPASRALRFAALYPFLDGGMSNPYEDSPRVPEYRQAFRQLAGLCLPERLNGLEDLKFELYNLYLAANWDRASEVLSRIAILDLIPTSELYFLRAQYWFLSVFGRRIQFELINRDIEYEFFWPIWLPEGTSETHEVARALYVFAHPENLTEGTPAHWALTAWCTNPRAPKPIHFDPRPIFRGDPDEIMTEVPAAAKG